MTYQAGYKNPPRATQFKRGCSGNPKGRPRKKFLSLLQYMAELEAKPVVVIKDGRKSHESGYSVAIQQLVRRFFQGDAQAWTEIMAAVKRHAGETPYSKFEFLGGLPEEHEDK